MPGLPFEFSTSNTIWSYTGLEGWNQNVWDNVIPDPGESFILWQVASSDLEWLIMDRLQKECSKIKNDGVLIFTFCNRYKKLNIKYIMTTKDVVH